jgi:Holliday junction DNA helicase RuvA
MIAKISGKVIEKGQSYLVIDVGGICYEVSLPAAIMQRIDESVKDDGTIELVTYHYYQVEPSKSIPVLVGFLNEIEKEFFQTFITVSGIGPRAALRAINQPISLIAKAIDEADINFLKSLPGIGAQRAKEIIAKLQNKVAKFGLMQDKTSNETRQPRIKDIEEEALSVLGQLQYTKAEAYKMIKKAQERRPDLATTEELLNEVYQQKRVS